MNSDNSGNRDIAFQEVQRFRQPWLWALLLCICLPIICVNLYGMYEQLILGNRWGDRPMSDTALVIVGTATVLLLIGILYLFVSMRLTTEVGRERLVVRFYPLTKMILEYTDIKECRAREYSPIKEFGGWGIRIGRGKKAYNVSGNKGVELELSSGKSFLIGSQRADALAEAIQHRLAAQSVPGQV